MKYENGGRAFFWVLADKKSVVRSDHNSELQAGKKRYLSEYYNCCAMLFAAFLIPTGVSTLLYNLDAK